MNFLFVCLFVCDSGVRFKFSPVELKSDFFFFIHDVPSLLSFWV